MEISSLNAAATPVRADSRNKAQISTEVAALSVQKADKPIQRQPEFPSVELYSSGKLNSAFSEAQTASRALSDSKQTATDAGARKVARNFVKTFNTAAQSARSAIASQGLLAGDVRARAAETDFRQALSADSTAAADLKKIGITRQTDGALAIDESKFDKAFKADPDSVRSTLSGVGQQIDQITTRALADNGNSGSSLDIRARSLEGRQPEQQVQAAAEQQAVNGQSARLNNRANTGIAAYQRIFSL